MFAIKEDNGRWILKKKFAFAFATLVVGSLFAAKGIQLASTAESVVVVLSSYGTFSGAILALIFAADITDKKLNDGKYN